MSRAVLVADIVDSVRLIEADERGTVARWLDFVASVERDLLPAHSGRMVKSLGDGFLAEFDDPQSAVAAALALQTACRAAERTVVEERRIRLRIGIDAGNLIANERDVYGHTVNLAARLAALAGADETVISAGVRDHLVQDVDSDLDDMGNCFLKNVRQPVRAYRVGPAQAPNRSALLSHQGALLPTLAVVPFECGHTEPEKRVLGDILAETLIDVLSRSSSVNVISRLSTSGFRSRPMAAETICGHVGAHYLLSGRYTADGDSLSVRVELVDGATGTAMWSDRMALPTDSIVDSESEVVDRIIEQIGRAIVVQEVQKARLSPLPTLDAHTLLIAAVNLMHRNTVEDFTLAFDLLQEIISRVPRHPIPHAHMAHWEVLRVQQGWSTNLARDGAVALDHTRRSLDADPDCALALTVEGLVNTHFLKRPDVARERYELAVEKNPNAPLAWLLKGTMHAFVDEGEQAVQDTRRALTLSPLDPHRYYYESLSATAHLAAGRNQDALELSTRSLKANRQHTSTLRVMLAAQWRLGLQDAARDSAATLLEREPDLTVSGWLRRSPTAGFSLGREFSEIMRSVGIPE